MRRRNHFGAGRGAAQGFFDFLFGGPQQRPPPPSYPPPPPAIGRIAPAPLGQERVNENAGTTGHGVAFCVRLCDGQHFPLERMANATPAETCKAICPTSATKVYFGSEIEGAVAGDGARYADLNTAFLYRKHLVANCSCNGKDPFGLATFDVKTDPTLRPGDIVSTKEGLMTYSGRGGQSAFTPVAPSTLGPQSRQKPTAPAAGRRAAAAGSRRRARHHRAPASRPARRPAAQSRPTFAGCKVIGRVAEARSWLVSATRH